MERIKRWNFEQKVEEDTELIKIAFRSNYLPPRVKLFNTIIKTQYSIPKPTFCNKCLKYGHFKKYCKNEQKCRTCSEIQTNEQNQEHNCSKVVKCNLCSSRVIKLMTDNVKLKL